MTVIPHFILKRLYKAGSLRRHSDGAAFDIHNNLGPGVISKVHAIRLNDREYTANQIKLVVNEQVMNAEEINDQNPARFFFDDTITCVVTDPALPEGAYKLTLDIVSKEAGRVTLSVDDQLKS